MTFNIGPAFLREPAQSTSTPWVSVGMHRLKKASPSLLRGLWAGWVDPLLPLGNGLDRPLALPRPSPYLSCLIDCCGRRGTGCLGRRQHSLKSIS